MHGLNFTLLIILICSVYLERILGFNWYDGLSLIILSLYIWHEVKQHYRKLSTNFDLIQLLITWKNKNRYCTTGAASGEWSSYQSVEQEKISGLVRLMLFNLLFFTLCFVYRHLSFGIFLFVFAIAASVFFSSYGFEYSYCIVCLCSMCS